MKSGKITATSSSSFGSIVYRIPAKYEGSTIQLEGYMKIKDVKNGFAGLSLRIDGDDQVLGFDNMGQQQITGTRDWQLYRITLPYPEKAESIFVAGILQGSGEAWFDDFVLTIDGKDIQTLAEVLMKAQLDNAFDQGSGIDIPPLTPTLVRNLELLGRVWGFLKYHHPAIGKGDYNWDYELFRFLPRYLNVDNRYIRDNLLIAWTKGLGEVAACTTCEPVAPDAFLRPDLKWIEEQAQPLKELLRYVYHNRHQGDHFYLESTPRVGNPQFIHENAYANMPFPDDRFLLLALCRYWNMIRYFFPYRHLMDKDWELVLSEYLPIFLNAENELAYELAALQLIGDIQDTHANLWRGADKIAAWRGQNHAPVHLRFIEDQLVVTDYYNPELQPTTGLAIGDIIVSIDGQLVTDLVKERAKYYPASNYPTQLRDIAVDMLRSNQEELAIIYINKDAEQVSRKIKLYPKNSLEIYRWYRRNNDLCYRLLDQNIGYVTLQSIKELDIPVIKEMFKNTQGIIIDIRNYPSTPVPLKLGSFFVKSPTPFVKFTIWNSDHPGEFVFHTGSEIPVNEGGTYQGKLVVLVNELSQSQAEYTTMAFRAGANTTVVGSTTAGADGDISRFSLPGGLRTVISGIGVYYPDGTETQRIGIVPDVEVKPTIAGIRAGRDEVLEQAIELILQD